MQDVARLSRRRQPGRTPAGRRRAGALGAALAATLLVGACHPGGDAAPAGSTTVVPSAPLLGADTPISVPPTMPLPPGYDQGDTRNVVLRPAVGQPRSGPPVTSVPMTGGSSRLTGIVRGPDGPVPGATVRIERFVADQVGRLDVTAAGDGTFAVTGLPGGRYRVRGWLRPFLTSTESAVTFLAAVSGDGSVELGLQRHNAMTMQTSVGVRAWQVGQQAGVSVLLTQEYVDDDGIARNGGVAGSTITLSVPAGLALLSDATTETGGDGYARFGLECSAPGQYTLSADSGGFSRPIPLPVCEAPPPPTTAPPPGPEVGQTVTVPGAGPYAAGTYTATDPTPNRCATTYELQTGAAWNRVAGGAVLQAPGPIRSLQPVAGTQPCTYRRSA
jgi:hypothetical protein